jgi:hypothetical protein
LLGTARAIALQRAMSWRCAEAAPGFDLDLG